LKEHRLSLERIETAARTIDPVFLNTPQFESESLSDDLGMRLILKVEIVNPIRSFKGRGTDFLVSNLPADSPALVCASAGNFGQGLAYAARKRGLQVVIFAAETANAFKLDRMRNLGAEVRLVGHDFDAAKEHAHAFAEQTGACYIEDGREPAIAEGAGSIAVELCRWKDAFDFLLVPLGNGALFAGVGRWMKAHSPATRMVAICATGAPSMALSIREGTVRCTDEANTIADGIAVRIPVPEALEDLRDVVDDVVLVEDNAILEAMRFVLRCHGLFLEPAGAAGVAAAMVFREKFRGGRVATLLTGGNTNL
jgi:threonine dehydratase